MSQEIDNKENSDSEKSAQDSKIIGQLHQTVAALEKKVETSQTGLNNFLTILPENLKTPEKLAAFIVQKEQKESEAPFDTADASENERIEKVLIARDDANNKKMARQAELHEQKLAALQEQLSKRDKADKERRTFEAWKETASNKYGLLPPYQEMAYESNKSQIALTKQGELLILDPDGEVSSTTVDDFFAAQKIAFPKIYAGSKMSGSGITSTANTANIETENWGQNKVIKKTDILSNLNALRTGKVTLE